MHLVVCLDNNNGMAFNGRRQSRDRELTRQMISMMNGNPLRMSPYSAKMFLDAPEGAVITSDDYLTNAGPQDFCFAETDDLTGFMKQVGSIIVFRWSRVYPADLWFPDVLSDWRKFFTSEFAGSSHEKITKEIYVRNEEA